MEHPKLMFSKSWDHSAFWAYHSKFSHNVQASAHGAPLTHVLESATVLRTQLDPDACVSSVSSTGLITAAVTLLLTGKWPDYKPPTLYVALVNAALLALWANASEPSCVKQFVVCMERLLKWQLPAAEVANYFARRT